MERPAGRDRRTRCPHAVRERQHPQRLGPVAGLRLRLDRPTHSGTSFFANGSRSAPAQPLPAWHEWVSQVIVAAKQVLAQRYGTAPRRTWMTGISNGGYLTRWQPQKRPELYDGGDGDDGWEGSLSRSQVSNLCAYLVTALRDYPISTVDPAARQRTYNAGFEPGSEPLCADHYAACWDLTQRVSREAFDADDDATTRGGTPLCQTGTTPGPATDWDAQYDHASQLQSVQNALAPHLAHRTHRQPHDHAVQRPRRPAADQDGLRRPHRQ